MEKYIFFLIFNAMNPCSCSHHYNDKFPEIIKTRLEECARLLPNDDKTRKLTINANITRDRKLTDIVINSRYSTLWDIPNSSEDRINNLLAQQDFTECVIDKKAMY